VAVILPVSVENFPIDANSYLVAMRLNYLKATDIFVVDGAVHPGVGAPSGVFHLGGGTAPDANVISITTTPPNPTTSFVQLGTVTAGDTGPILVVFRIQA
jgi:hypothetical protein